MPNMDYCRFQNIVDDLEDCVEHLFDTGLSPSERHAHTRFVALCRGIVEALDDEDDVGAFRSGEDDK